MRTIKLLGLLLLIIFIVGCGDYQLEPTTQEEMPEYEEYIMIPEMPEPVEDSYIPVHIIGIWQIQFAESAIDGTDYSIQWLYGTGIRYGGAFRFNDDGTFSRFVGIHTNELEHYTGNFSVNGNDITLIYGNGSVGIARFLPESQLIQCHRWIAREYPVYVYFAKVD